MIEDYDEEIEETPRKKEKYTDDLVRWQTVQFDKTQKLILRLLDFSNKEVELPPEHELLYTTKSGGSIGIPKIKIHEIFNFTVNKLDANGIDERHITEVDADALLRVIDFMLGEINRVKVKITDSNQYILQANQGLLIKINELTKLVKKLSKYESIAIDYEEGYTKMEEKLKDFIRELEFKINQIQNGIEKVKTDFKIDKEGNEDERDQTV